MSGLVGDSSGNHVLSGLSVVVVLSTWRQSRRTTRGHRLLVHVPAALWECWDPSYWWTYQRRCGMMGPEIRVDVPAALCKRWAQGFDARAGTSAGQPTRELVGRETVFCVRCPHGFFLTRLVPPSRSQRSSTWCRGLWYFHRRGLTSTVQCPRSLLLLPYYFFSPSPFISRCSSQRFEFNKTGSTGRENGEVFKSGSTGI